MRSMMKVGSWFAPLFALMAVACTTPNPSFDAGNGNDGSSSTCNSNAECDDHIPCTADSCLVDHSCQHTLDNTMCPMGQTCMAGRGCASGTVTCNSNAQCDDHIACTMDSCLVDHSCSHMPVNSMCPTGQMCGAAGCTASCTGPSDCDDTFDCTIDSCGSDGHCVHTAQNNRCPTGRQCSPMMGCVMTSSCGSDTQCDDHVYCNGTERCSTELACVSGTAVVCTNPDPCMMGTCSEAMHGACVFTMNPACMPGRSGTYNQAPEVDYSCEDNLGLGMQVVDMDITFFQVSNTGSGLTITGGNSSGRGAPPPMRGPTPAADGSFRVTGVRSGGCTETYTLTGHFPSATMMTGTLAVTFMGSDCSVTTCTTQSFTISATLR